MTKVAIALFILCAALGAHAHSGGTDSQGCHVDHKTGTKHCHWICCRVSVSHHPYEQLF